MSRLPEGFSEGPSCQLAVAAGVSVRAIRSAEATGASGGGRSGGDGGGGAIKIAAGISATATGAADALRGVGSSSRELAHTRTALTAPSATCASSVPYASAGSRALVGSEYLALR